MARKILKTGTAGAVLTLLLGMVLCPQSSGIVSETRAVGPSLSVQIPEPFEFQGRLWPAATLKLVPVATYNPMSSLDEVWIGAECLGRMIAERHPAVRKAIDDVVVFQRNAEERLVLVGYALRGTNLSFRYRPALPSLAAPAREAAGYEAIR